jgi:large subunit ribosomal protein L22
MIYHQASCRLSSAMAFRGFKKVLKNEVVNFNQTFFQNLIFFRSNVSSITRSASTTSTSTTNPSTPSSTTTSSSSSSSSSIPYVISELDTTSNTSSSSSSTSTFLQSSIQSFKGKRGFLSYPGGLSSTLKRSSASLRSVKGHTKKLNPIARLVTGLSVSKALGQLAFSASSRALAVSKVIERALVQANIEHGLQRNDLIIESAWTGKHISYPRLRHHAKGRGGKSFKRTSQISISVREKINDEIKQKDDKEISKKISIDVRGY